jgi:hypothetical protein
MVVRIVGRIDDGGGVSVADAEEVGVVNIVNVRGK